MGAIQPQEKSQRIDIHLQTLRFALRLLPNLTGAESLRRKPPPGGQKSSWELLHVKFHVLCDFLPYCTSVLHLPPLSAPVLNEFPAFQPPCGPSPPCYQRGRLPPLPPQFHKLNRWLQLLVQKRRPVLGRLPRSSPWPPSDSFRGSWTPSNWKGAADW